MKGKHDAKKMCKADKNQVYVLQSRWKIGRRHLVYYGIRKAPYTFRNSVAISRSVKDSLQKMDGVRTLGEIGLSRGIGRLIGQGIIVPQSEYRADVTSLREAHFCKRCVANDYLIPGLELDDEGLCPMCAQREQLKDLRAIMPAVETVPPNPKGEFDVAVFYTGGKDSSFLLYYLAKVKKCRVLSLTWETEYMSDSARKSIENAKKALPEVTFVVEKLDKDVMRRIYRKHFELAGNTCMCPAPAYAMFYPLLVEKHVPYLVLGNEPAQMHNLLFNNISPAFAFRPKWQAAGRFFFNLARLLLLKKPLKGGQMQMYFTVRGLAKGVPWGKSNEGNYQNEQVRNVHAALSCAPELMGPLRASLKKSDRRARMPQFVHIDFNDVADGYRWKEIKALLKEEIGWADSAEENKSLHTSCKIEKCKEYTQFMRFRRMESRTIPFSAVELALAVGSGNVPREEALREIEHTTGFFGCPAEYAEMMEPFSPDEEEGAEHVENPFSGAVK